MNEYNSVNNLMTQQNTEYVSLYIHFISPTVFHFNLYHFQLIELPNLNLRHDLRHEFSRLRVKTRSELSHITNMISNKYDTQNELDTE